MNVEPLSFLLFAHAAMDSFHGTAEASTQPVLLRWTFPLLPTLGLTLMSLVYGLGVFRLWGRAGVCAGGISRRQAGAFAVGIVVLAIALVSPVDALSDELGWMHMIQHMLLMAVGAPILVLGSPGVAMLWLLPLSWRKKFGTWKSRAATGRWVNRLAWQPVVLLLLYTFTLWVWHLPRLYEAALHDDLVHDFQHFTFIATSMLFWRVLLDPISRHRMSRAGAMFYLFLTTMQATMLGVFMTLAPTVWYPTYDGRTDVWNLTAIQDQQIAGLIMWMPACTIYAVIAAVALTTWLEAENRSGVRRAKPGCRT